MSLVPTHTPMSHPVKVSLPNLFFLMKLLIWYVDFCVRYLQKCVNIATDAQISMYCKLCPWSQLRTKINCYCLPMKIHESFSHVCVSVHKGREVPCDYYPRDTLDLTIEGHPGHGILLYGNPQPVPSLDMGPHCTGTHPSPAPWTCSNFSVWTSLYMFKLVHYEAHMATCLHLLECFLVTWSAHWYPRYFYREMLEVRKMKNLRLAWPLQRNIVTLDVCVHPRVICWL